MSHSESALTSAENRRCTEEGASNRQTVFQSQQPGSDVRETARLFWHSTHDPTAQPQKAHEEKTIINQVLCPCVGQVV